MCLSLVKFVHKSLICVVFRYLCYSQVRDLQTIRIGSKTLTSERGYWDCRTLRASRGPQQNSRLLGFRIGVFGQLQQLLQCHFGLTGGQTPTILIPSKILCCP